MIYEHYFSKKCRFLFWRKKSRGNGIQRGRKNQTPIYTFGPIIHNEEVVADLEKKGVQVIHSTDELKGRPKGTVIIRSHGVERKIYDEIKALGFEIVDATCPFVLKIHRLVEQYNREGYHIIIIGNETHPEVEGIKGWSDPTETTVIGTCEEAEKFTLSSEKKSVYCITNDI